MLDEMLAYTDMHLIRLGFSKAAFLEGTVFISFSYAEGFDI